jgi:hypothetical protein
MPKSFAASSSSSSLAPSFAAAPMRSLSAAAPPPPGMARQSLARECESASYVSLNTQSNSLTHARTHNHTARTPLHP